MRKKVIFLAIIIISLLGSFGLGIIFEYLKYKVPLASCQATSVNNSDYDKLEMSEYMNKMVQNFYTRKIIFKYIYIPKDSSFKDYYTNFNNGGFHIFETDKNDMVVCGLFK